MADPYGILLLDDHALIGSGRTDQAGPSKTALEGWQSRRGLDDVSQRYNERLLRHTCCAPACG